MILRFYLSAIISCIASFSMAQEGYPVPPDSSTRLFYIQHNNNHNTFVYDANMASATHIHEEDPIDIYRYIYTAGGIKEDLTKMQLRMAYGIRFKKITSNHFEFSLVAYPSQKFHLKIKDKVPYVTLTVNKKTFTLSRMFLQQKENSTFLSTKLDYIIFYGKDRHGKAIQEKFIP